MFIEFNTFLKRLADSKLSTNTCTYLMFVAAVFQKLQVKVDVTYKVSIETKLHNST